MKVDKSGKEEINQANDDKWDGKTHLVKDENEEKRKLIEDILDNHLV